MRRQATLQRIAALLERGDAGRPAACVEPALKAHPADPVLQNLAGVIAAQQGASSRRRRTSRRRFASRHRVAAAYENLGRLYQERADGDPAMRAKALTIYRRLLDADPANVEGLFQSGFLLALDGQFAASRAMLERLPEDVRQRPQALAVLAADLPASADTAAARRMRRRSGGAPGAGGGRRPGRAPGDTDSPGDEVAALMLDALDRRGLASPRAAAALAAIHIRGARFAEARQMLERVAAAAGPSAPLLMDLARTPSS